MDAGSTYADARDRLEKDHPDVKKKVLVIEVTPDIPNDGVQFGKLKSPGAGVTKFVVLMLGILVGAAIYLPAAIPNIPHSSCHTVLILWWSFRSGPGAARRTLLL